MDSELEEMLDAALLDGRAEWDLDELRDLRNRCKRVEASLSYLRRLAQGRIDIIGAELDRRRDGGDPLDLDALVGRLPEALSVGTRSTQVGPMPQVLAPGEIDAALANELAGMEVEARLSELPSVSTEWLEQARMRLSDFEERVSGFRRVLFERIDGLGAELVRRYRVGDADIDVAISDH